MNLPKLAIRRPVGTLVFYIGIVALGMVGYTRLSVDLLPDIDFPRISITTLYEGVAPEEIETLITRPIEQVVATLQGLQTLESVSAEGISRISLMFDWGVELNDAVADVRGVMDRVNSRLPEGADRPTIFKFNLADAPVAFVSVTGSLDPRRLLYIADQEIGRRLERVSGVAAAQVHGGRAREIQVLLEPARLVALRISAASVIAALRGENRNVSAGNAESAGLEIAVRTLGEFTSVKDILQTVVTTRNGRPVTVADIATVQDSIAQIRSELWIDGEPGVRIRIAKQSGTNTVDVVEALKREISAINRDYAGRVQLGMLRDSSVFIKRAITNVSNGALVGSLLAVMILLLFLRDWRATTVIATAIPISVIATFGLMHQLGYSLNVVSFGGLALGIGMLVDNAIVILESIVIKRDQGKSPTEAAETGTNEVWLPVIAGTMTTLVVFLPVIFMSGFSGIFFTEMAVVVSFSLASSLLVAVTLVPSLAARMLRQEPARDRQNLPRIYAQAASVLNRIEAAYAVALEKSLLRMRYVFAAVGGLLVSAALLWPSVNLELMPESDEGQLDVDIELPIGTPVERSAAVILEAERLIREVVKPEEIQNVVTTAGPENWWQTKGGNESEVDITFVPASKRGRSVAEIADVIRNALQHLPDANIRVRPTSSNMLSRLMRGGSGERLAVEIFGHEPAETALLGEAIVAAMKKIPGIADARIDREIGADERAIRIDRSRSAEFGLGVDQVAQTIQTYLLGQAATKFRERGDEFDVRVRMAPGDRFDWQYVKDLPLIVDGGAVVPLGAIATFEAQRGPSSISRKGQQRVATVGAGLEDVALESVIEPLRQALAEIPKPPGFVVRLAGELEAQQENFRNLLVGILLAIFLVYAVMAIQFESLSQPLLVMVSIPLGLAGVIWTLVLTGTTFNLNTFLGVIVLVGIVVNNAIVFVDYANLLIRERGFEVSEAILETGRRRLRPILMTSSTTILAMLPIALGIGDGAEIQAPLGRSIVGGLFVSTVATLFVLPVLYKLAANRLR